VSAVFVGKEKVGECKEKRNIERQMEDHVERKKKIPPKNTYLALSSGQFFEIKTMTRKKYSLFRNTLFLF